MKAELQILSWSDVLVSLVFILFTVILVRYWRLGLVKTLLIGTFRTFVQLTLMGYLLTYIFGQKHWGFMLGLIMLMLLVASFEAKRRQKVYIPRFFPTVALSLLITVIFVLGTTLGFIMDVKPWYYPYAMIPIAGMILGNGMNSVSLTANRFVAEMTHRENEIETQLALGASPRQAVQDTLKESIQAALIPNINGLMTVGLVQLPGVMTGQILSGVEPIIAVRYQIMIMYMWITTAAMANILTLGALYRQYFNSQMQLRRDLLRGNRREKGS